MMKSKEQMLVEAMMNEPKVDILESQDRKFKNALSNKINQAVSKEYEVENKAKEMLEQQGLKEIVSKLNSVDARLEVADRVATKKIDSKKAEIEEAYNTILEKFYAKGGMKGNVSERMMLDERDKAISSIIELDEVKVLVDAVRQLEVERDACKEALNIYFNQNKQVIMEEMKKKQDEEKRADIRESGILELL